MARHAASRVPEVLLHGGSDGARTRPESNAGLTKSSSPSQGDSQEKGEIAEVVAAWPQLTDQLKAAVLAIVRTALQGVHSGRD
jgi:hypothetical protein